MLVSLAISCARGLTGICLLLLTRHCACYFMRLEEDHEAEGGTFEEQKSIPTIKEVCLGLK